MAAGPKHTDGCINYPKVYLESIILNLLTNSLKIDSVCVIDDDMVYQFLAKEEIEWTNLVNKISHALVKA